MENKFISAVLIALLSFGNLSSFGQSTQTITIQPGISDGKDVMISTLAPGTNSGNSDKLTYSNYTLSPPGGMVIKRTLMSFSLPVPANATINSAILVLTTNTEIYDNTLTPTYISRITSTWDKSSVSWNNQPTVSSTNQYTGSIFSSPASPASVDITPLIQDMIQHPDSNFGFMMRCVNEDTTVLLPPFSNGNSFVSSNHIDYPARPRLIIQYTCAFPSAVLVLPSGGETFYTNAPMRISWNTTNIGKLKLEYSTGASLWNLIDSADASEKKYDWVIPSSVSGAIRIRISDSSDTYSDSSDVFNVTQASYIKFKPGPARGKDASQVFYSGGALGSRYGQDTILEVDYTKWTGYRREAMSMLQFDLESISDHDPILDAELVLYLYRNAANSAMSGFIENMPFSVNRVTSLWKDTTASSIALPSYVSNAPPIKLVAFSTNDSLALIIKVRDMVEAMVQGANNGFMLQQATNAITVPNGLIQFFSSEALDSSKWPELRISYIDYPDTSKVEILSPSLQDTLGAGNLYRIEWSASHVDSVRLEYSFNDTFWNVITPSVVASAGHYNWKVPDMVAPKVASIRIITAADSTVGDTSLHFTIVRPSVSLISPVSTDTLKSGVFHTIKWSANHADSVRLEYSFNDTLWNAITSSRVASSGQYNWKVPYVTAPARAKIRIFTVADSSITDTSEYFTIVLPSVSLLSPGSQDTLESGTLYRIEWSSEYVSSVKLEYSFNDTLWYLITPALPAFVGAYDWAVPDVPLSRKASIRISNGADANIADSGEHFLIVHPSLSLLSPLPQDTLESGSLYRIEWLSNYADSVRLEYSYNSTLWNVITTISASAGYYDWTVANVPVSAWAGIRIVRISNGNIADTSGRFLIIHPSVSLLSPVSQDTLESGTLYRIEWSSDYVDSVRLEYSFNGILWNVITSTAASTGYYNWTVANVPVSGTASIRILSVSDSNVSDTVEHFLIIHPSVSLLSPASQDTLESGTLYRIEWSSDYVDSVRLEYSFNGTLWNVITSTTASAGYYDWTVANVLVSGQARIRVSAVSDADIADTGEYFLIIHPSVSLLSPGSQDTLESGTLYRIEWSSNYVDSVRLEYSFNGTLWNVITSTTASAGYYDWTVANVLVSGQAKIRISAVSDADIADTGEYFLIIHPSVSLLSPASQDTLESGTLYRIEWSSDYVDSVKLEYSFNGTLWNVITSTTASVGYYDWTVANVLVSGQAKIRISAVSDADIADTGEYFLIIHPSVSLLSPILQDTLESATLYRIEWSANYVDSVKLEYSFNDTLWNIIIPSLAAFPGHYDWMVPNVSVPGVAKIRISSVKESNVSDTSEPFTIIPEHTGINDFDGFNNSWSIYPNPTDGAFFIEKMNKGSHDISYSIFNLEGKKVFSSIKENVTAGDSIYQVNIMESGVYIIQLEYDGKIYHKKLIVR